MNLFSAQIMLFVFRIYNKLRQRKGSRIYINTFLTLDINGEIPEIVAFLVLPFALLLPSFVVNSVQTLTEIPFLFS